MEHAKVWFIRMALDLRCTVMACGNVSGQVYLWDMHTLTDQPKAVLSRQTAISKTHGKPTSDNITVRIALAVACLRNWWVGPIMANTHLAAHVTGCGTNCARLLCVPLFAALNLHCRHITPVQSSPIIVSIISSEVFQLIVGQVPIRHASS